MGTHCLVVPSKAGLYLRFSVGDILYVSSYIAQREF
jgi:hypothetical protein